MGDYIKFTRNNWNQVKAFTVGLAKDFTVEKCIDGKSFCRVPTKTGYEVVREDQFICIGEEFNDVFTIETFPPISHIVASVKEEGEKVITTDLDRLKYEHSKYKTALLYIRMQVKGTAFDIADAALNDNT